MSLQDKLDYLNETKSLIRQSIINKGVDVTEQDTFRSYAGKIDQIQQGGDDPEPTGDYRVRFYDYDGTLLKEEWVDSGEDATPPTPPNYGADGNTRPALLFMEWNNSYTNITKDIDIGAIYTTADGKTHFYLQITPTSGKDITLYVNVGINTTIELDFGDGSPPQTYTTAGNRLYNHTFTDYGLYHCKISAAGICTLGHSTTTTSFSGGRTTQQNNTLLACYIGQNCMLGSGAFREARSLQKATMPLGHTSLSNSVFYGCHSLSFFSVPSSITTIGSAVFSFNNSLSRVVFPDGLTDLGASSLQSCVALQDVIIPSGVTILSGTFNASYGFKKIIIPSGVQTIAGYTFYNSLSVRKYILEGDTVKTLSATTAFQSINTACLIFVKDSLVGNYKTATNWVTYANYIMPMSEEGNYYG